MGTECPMPLCPGPQSHGPSSATGNGNETGVSIVREHPTHLHGPGLIDWYCGGVGEVEEMGQVHLSFLFPL